MNLTITGPTARKNGREWKMAGFGVEEPPGQSQTSWKRHTGKMRTRASMCRTCLAVRSWRERADARRQEQVRRLFHSCFSRSLQGGTSADTRVQLISSLGCMIRTGVKGPGEMVVMHASPYRRGAVAAKSTCDIVGRLGFQCAGDQQLRG